jgi:Kef-type K+ transport system membrane component KefB
MTNRSAIASAVLGLAGVLLLPVSLAAYGGPGSVITGIGALLAVVAAVVAAVFGFFWFPVKRLVRKIRGTEDDGADAPDAV